MADQETKTTLLSEVLAGPKRPFTPLYVMVVVIALIDVVAFVQVGRSSGAIQIVVLIFAVSLAILIVGGFFAIL